MSDELRMAARGLETLVRKNKRADFDALGRIISQNGVRLVVLGHPIRLNGEPGAQARWAAEFGETLRARTGAEVQLWDERWSSREAERALKSRGRSFEKSDIDRVSAIILLQSYLDALEFQRPSEKVT